MSGSVDPDEMPGFVLHLIWVYIVCSGLSIQILTVNTRYNGCLLKNYLTTLKAETKMQQMDVQTDMDMDGNLKTVYLAPTNQFIQL